MFKLSNILLALALIGFCSTHAAIFGNELSNTEDHSHMRSLIENVAADLQKVAVDAGQAVTNFTAGIQEQVDEFRKRLFADVAVLQQILQQAASNASLGVANAGLEVMDCVTNSRKEAEVALNEAVKSAISCADNRLDNIIGQITSLISLTEQASSAAEDIRAKLPQCTSSGNVFSMGRCLTGLLWETNIKAASITGQTALQIARINLSVAALPSALNVCMASELASATLSAGTLVQNLAKCSLGIVAGN